MNKYGYEGDEAYRPLSPWGYFGYSLLFCIPVVGFVLLIVFSVSSANINRRNYARSFWCGLLAGLIALVVLTVLAVTSGGVENLMSRFRTWFALQS